MQQLPVVFVEVHDGVSHISVPFSDAKNVLTSEGRN